MVHGLSLMVSAMTRLLTRVCSALAASHSGHAQEPDLKAHFSSESQLVVLHVAVRDRKGGYVGGLGHESFRVSENKRRRKSASSTVRMRRLRWVC